MFKFQFLWCFLDASSLKSRLKKSVIDALPVPAYLGLRKFAYDGIRSLWMEGSSLKQPSVELEKEDYSLYPFENTNSIFIHIPKCAGVSLAQTLYGCLAGGHSTLEDYINQYSPLSLLNKYRFTIVRNPWDRLVSAYHFLRAGGMNDNGRDFFARELRAFSTFEDFVMGWVTAENVLMYPHFMPQHKFIIDRHQKVPLNFIGFYENLEADASAVARRVMGKGDFRLPQTNRSYRSDYREYYSSNSAERVKKIYHIDLKMLGYTFDNSSLTSQIQQRSKDPAFYLRRLKGR